MIRPTAVIWDFNGTILDDVELAAASISVLLRRRGLPTIDAEGQRQVFGFPVSGYYERLGFDLTKEPQAGLSNEFHEAYTAGIPDCSLNAGVREALDHFRAADVAQYVLSAAQQEMVVAWAETLGVEAYFEGIYGLEDRLAADKEQRAGDLIRDFGLRAEETLFIGDTDHDIEVAAGQGCYPVAVLQGHQTRERFDGLDCEVFDTFCDLLEAFGQDS